MTEQPAVFLEWDSQHFGCRIAQAKVRRLTEASWPALQSWCIQNTIDCLYFMGDEADQTSIRQAQRRDFDLVDTRLTFERLFKTPPAMPEIGEIRLRLSSLTDADELAAITRDRFSLSRFHADPCFDREAVEQMYQIWIRKSVTSDFDDAILVAERGDELLGYVTCRLSESSRMGKVGLHCVAESAQGKGIGSILMRYASWWFHQQGMRGARSVTQTRNIGSQVALQRAGYVTRAVGITFHKWFSACPERGS